jgi:hypothetical protein
VSFRSSFSDARAGRHFHNPGNNFDLVDYWAGDIDCKSTGEDADGYVAKHCNIHGNSFVSGGQ